MAITFDETNKWILLPNVTSITAQEIYNEAMDFHDNQGAMDSDPPMLSTGFAPLGGGAYSDKIFILNNGWKLKPYSGTYTLTIIGTIITDDESARTVPPDSGVVQVIFQVTSQGIISVSGSGVTQQDKQDIADLVEVQTGVPIKGTGFVQDTHSLVPIKTKVNPLPPDPAKESSVDSLEAGLGELQGQIVNMVTQLVNMENVETGKIVLENDILTIYDYVDPNKIHARYKLTIVNGKVTQREKIA